MLILLANAVTLAGADGAINGAIRGAIIGGIVGGVFGLLAWLFRKKQK